MIEQRDAGIKGGSIGRPDSWLGAYIFRSRVSGDRVSGTGLLVRVRVRVLNLHLVPNTRTRDLTAETWDLRMNLIRSIHSGLRFPFEWMNRCSDN